jgi:hypothetical protein
MLTPFRKGAMKDRNVVALALSVTALTGSLVAARAGLEPSSQDIDLGQFKVGQRRECTISIKNLTRAALGTLCVQEYSS